MTALVVRQVPIEDPTPHPNNPRRGDLTLISASLERFGQLKPIVVQDSTGYVVAGNHMLAAARGLGWAEIAVLRVELTDDEAQRFLLMDNRSSDVATWDDTGLNDLLDEMNKTDGLLDGTGFTMDDVDDLRAALDEVANVDFATFAGGYAEEPEETSKGYTKPADHTPMKQMMLLYPPDEHERLMADLAKLKKAWKVSTREAVARVVREAARALDG